MQRSNVSAIVIVPSASSIASYSGKPRFASMKPRWPSEMSTKDFWGYVATGVSNHVSSCSGTPIGRETTPKCCSACERPARMPVAKCTRRRRSFARLSTSVSMSMRGMPG